MTPQQSGNDRSVVKQERRLLPQQHQQRSDMHHAVTVTTGRGGDIHGYQPSHHAAAGPYPLHASAGSIGRLGLRQQQHKDSGPLSSSAAAAGNFIHQSSGRGVGTIAVATGSQQHHHPSHMGLMGSAAISMATATSTGRGGGGRVVAVTPHENKRAFHAPAETGAVARQCEREGCSVQPSYGTAWKKPRFCARHKLQGMMDVRNRRCEHVGCTRQPSYGQEGQRRQFCFTHKREGDVDVKSTRCKSAGCPKHAMYGRPGEMPQYCSAHKAEDMVDVKKRRRCNADGCDRRASYALEGEKAAFCSAHKQPGHVNVNNRRCEYHGCSRRPIFSRQGEKPRFCAAHKLEGMSDSRMNTEAGTRARAMVCQPQPPIAAVTRGGGGQGNYGTPSAHHLAYGGGRPGTRGNDPTMFPGAMGHPATSGGHSGSRTAGSISPAAHATVSAAAAVIAAMEDGERLDYRGSGVHHHQHPHHGSNKTVGYSYHPGETSRLGGGGSVRNGTSHVSLNGSSGGGGHGGYRETDSSEGLYDYGGGSGSGGGMTTRSGKADPVGSWTSALFAADQDSGTRSWASDGMRGGGGSHPNSPPSSVDTMAPSHGGALWTQQQQQQQQQQQSSSSRGGNTNSISTAQAAAQAATAVAVVALADASPPGSADNYHHHMSPSVMSEGGSHYLDDRNSREMLSNNSVGGGSGSGRHGGGSGGGGGGGGGGGDFFSSFTDSTPQFDSSPRDHQVNHAEYHSGGGGGGGGGVDSGDLAWERRPRPPPLPAPLPPPSSWSRGGMGGLSSSADIHRLAGLLPTATVGHRLPSLINNNNNRLSSPPLSSHSRGLPYDKVESRGMGGRGTSEKMSQCASSPS